MIEQNNYHNNFDFAPLYFCILSTTTQQNNKITFDTNFVFEVISIYDRNMQHYSGTPHSLKDEMFIS